MQFRTRSVLAVGLAALAATAGIGVTIGTAAADTKFVTVWASGTCDQVAGEWSVIWHVKNQSEEPATITDVNPEPEGSKIVYFPSEAPSGVTVYGNQRVPATGGATINFTASWADGTTQPNTWYFSPVSTCTKVEPAPSPTPSS